MYYESSVQKEEKLQIKYQVLKGNAFRYIIDNQESISLHYALKNNFIVSSLTERAEYEVFEGSFLIAKEKESYILNNYKTGASAIFTFIIDKQYFCEELVKITRINGCLKEFALNAKAHLALLTYNFEDNNINDTLNTSEFVKLENRTPSQAQLKTLLREIFLCLDYKYQCKTLGSNSLIENILEYIRLNPTTVNLKVLNEKYKYSISYISELIHKETGLTFSQILKSIRLAKSLELLETTNKTVNEIGESIGYTSTPGFIGAFYDMYNMTPSEYRRYSKNLN